MLELIHRLQAQTQAITESIITLQTELEHTPTDTVTGIQQRSFNLCQLGSVEDLIKEQTRKFSQLVSKEKESITKEIAKTTQTLLQIEKTLERNTDNILPVPTPEVSGLWASIASKPPVVNDSVSNDTRPKTTRMQIAQGVYLQAYKIEDPHQCHNFPGWWCYCKETDRFHLSINNEILNATTTYIRPYDDAPYKFVEHKDCNVDYTTTNFYVPRERNAQSRDIRHLTNRMEFIPASRRLGSNDKYAYRVGSRETLRQDLAAMDDIDYRLIMDITGNFMLCWTAGAREMNRRCLKNTV